MLWHDYFCCCFRYHYHYSGLHDHRTLIQRSRPCRISINPSLEKLGNTCRRRWWGLKEIGAAEKCVSAYTLQFWEILQGESWEKGLMNEQNLHWIGVWILFLFICRFETIFPLELEGRIQPSELSSFLNAINTKLAEAYAMTPNITDNLIAVATLWTSLLWKTSHFEKKLREVEKMIGDANKEMFNKAGLNVLSPRDVALQFVSLLFFFVLFCLSSLGNKLLMKAILTVTAGDWVSRTFRFLFASSSSSF